MLTNDDEVIKTVKSRTRLLYKVSNGEWARVDGVGWDHGYGREVAGSYWDTGRRVGKRTRSHDEVAGRRG